MLEDKELRVEGDNLTRVSFFCDCGAEILFDLSENKQRDIPWNEKHLQCTVCDRALDGGLRTALMNLGALHTVIQNTKLKLFFRVRDSLISNKSV